MKRITDLMTPQPWTVQLDDSLAVARRMIAECEVHQLPVLDGGVVVGMVTERDLVRTDDRVGTVAEILVAAPRVAVDTPLDEVLDAMVAKRWDAVVVTRGDTVEGIFTASDAVRALRDLVRLRDRELERGDVGPE